MFCYRNMRPSRTPNVYSSCAILGNVICISMHDKVLCSTRKPYIPRFGFKYIIQKTLPYNPGPRSKLSIESYKNDAEVSIPSLHTRHKLQVFSSSNRKYTVEWERLEQPMGRSHGSEGKTRKSNKNPLKIPRDVPNRRQLHIVTSPALA